MASKKETPKEQPKPPQKIYKEDKQPPPRGTPGSTGYPREAEQSPRGTKPVDPKKK